MKVRIGVIGVALSAAVLWACSSTLPGMNGTQEVDGGAGDDGGNGAVAPPAEGGTSNLALASDPQGLCTKIVGCAADAGADGGSAGPPLTQADCLLLFQTTRYAPSCLDGINSASCADLLGTAPALSSCFPSCATPGGTHCNGDGTVTTCSADEVQYVIDCARVCTSQKLTWTGVCGSSYQGMPSKSGHDQCFCE